MLKNIGNALGITVEHTAPPVQPRAGSPYKLQELLRESDKTQPASNIKRWPIDQQLRIVERARSELVSAEAASERCRLHLDECLKAESSKQRDLEREQNKLYTELRDCGAFDRRGDLPEWMREALKPVAEPDSE